ncbi:hypothetical protein MED134_03614 [Dokdonia sp. MED134]|uniref:lipocalin-like domain-containing protein n=1 Tax=Dokdonia sp. MED134 TaxID=313590 RepID=UPI0001F815CF|nr:glycoside hydrolase family 43 C-terminal domain-containing protein [Dokdonia sp. MED134]EAQ38368.2 hypothetical protein MED134_03614 [Dokdonia sp. MED134]
MKKIVFIIISILIYNSGFSQNLTEDDLIGEWEFIELQDENGDKQTKIPLIRFGRDMGIENVNRDSYIFKEDGTYKSFNPLNVSVGTWYFDKKTKEINLELQIAPDHKFLPSLKKAKIVKKRKDGFYYQKPVIRKILMYSDDAMTIADREKYVLIYKRKE